MSKKLESSSGGRFWPGFRQELLDCLRRLLAMRTSGALVGLAGSGKSNLLLYLSRSPELMGQEGQSAFTVLVTVDLNYLVDRQPTTLYRLILRGCWHQRHRFSQAVASLIEQLYDEYKHTTDLFLAQTAVHDLLVAVEKQEGRLVLILDQFDTFCRTASPELTRLLRSLRDGFKETLIYIVGMRQAAMYMPEPEILGDLYHLLDTHVCWVGAMRQTDAEMFVVQEVGRANQRASAEDVAMLLALTGGYPALLKAACAWWVTVRERPSPQKWRTVLATHLPLQNRLKEIWQDLTQEERWILAELQNGEQAQAGELSERSLRQLSYRGLCEETDVGWQVKGLLLQDFVQTAVQRGLGRIWQRELTGELFQGSQRIEGLRPLEEALLTFLVNHPYKFHTKSEIIQHVWPTGIQIEGVTDDSLYQIVRGVRQQIEPKTAENYVYLRTKRGVDEGGYQFFPEGFPEN
ncbi:MAG: winged helix-turn-helix domain-containing protein [Ardenticatenaceae bacterium]|nr:winged helix-turn-helix domain-containing protein [Ardenticatenaceae bacterium]